MGYKIVLSSCNIKSLEWAVARGYFPREFLHGIEREERNVYLVPEHVAWELTMFEEQDPHAFLTCMPEDVVGAIRQLMEEIV